MSNPLSTYFNHRLRWLGYENMECYYSLGHCQGDGVAFYGKVELSETLLKRVLYMGPHSIAPDRFKAVTETAKWIALSEHIHITIQSNDNHYNHSGTMSVNVEVDEDAVTEAIESGAIPWVSSESFTAEDVYEEVEQMIQDDIREISCMLVSEGYDFADAEGLGYSEEPVAHIEVRGSFRVTVEITERHDTDGDELESLIGLDGGDDLGFIHSTLNQIRAGELRVASLRAKLEQLDDDGDVLEEIDYLYLGGVTYNPKIRCFGGAEKEIAADLFSQNEKLIFSFANEMSTVPTRQEVAA